MKQGWNWAEKKVTESRMAKYEKELVVYVSKSGRIIFSKRAIEALKSPAYVAMGQRGSNIAFVGATSEQGWKVVYHSKEKIVDPFIAVKYTMDKWALKPGFFECHIEGGDILVFDREGTPSK